MKTPNLKEVEKMIRDQAEKIIVFMRKHKKLLAIGTIMYIIVNYLLEEEDESEE